MLVFGAGDLDRELLLRLYAGQRPWLAAIAEGVTQLGDWPTVVTVTIAGALWLIYRGARWSALSLLIATFTGRALVILQKGYFDRLRPEEHLRMVDVSYQSFPSGHAANPTIAYVGLALLLFDEPRHRRVAAVAAVVLALLIGVSRPMLGVHWPSDVIAGWAFGLLWLTLVFGVMERWRPGVRR